VAYLKNELEGFIPEETAAQIIQEVAKGSSLLKLARVEEMKTDTKKFPVLANGPGAYWVGEGDRIETSGAAWLFPEMTAKKLAVIIPVTKEKMQDAAVDVFNELKNLIAEAFYKAIDLAAFFGMGSPWAKNILQSAVNAGNVIVTGVNSLDIDVSNAMAGIEDAGLEVNGFAAGIGIRNALRLLRDSSGNKLYVDGVGQKELYGLPVTYVNAVDPTLGSKLVFAADWAKCLVGIRAGIEYETLKEATLQNTLYSDGKPLSLAEQDMIGVKATMRLGFLPVKDEAFAVAGPLA